MKEGPIIFSSDMVRSIREDRKTMTRRLVKNATGAFWDHGGWYPTLGQNLIVWRTHDGQHEASMPFRCRYGSVGDRLWVREAYCELVPEHRTHRGVREFAYRSDTSPRSDGDEARQDYIALGCPYQWRSPRFMPRIASRLTLEITQLRLERLRDITEADAIAEGVRETFLPLATVDGCRVFHAKDYPTGSVSATAVDAYRVLWDKLNRKRATWESNPWVLVVGFRRLP